MNGQVGFELVRALQGLGRVIAVDRTALDLSNLDQVRTVVREIRPSLIINAAAYTAVEKAESEFAAAMRINSEAPGVLAEEAKKLGAALIHFSTDYVFNGEKDGAYVEEDVTDPQNAYGHTKLAGERAIEASGVDHLIFRTSWIYGARGKSFLTTMLRLGADRSEIKVVADQYGAPTWSNTVASLTAHIVAQAGVAADTREWWATRSGVYHMTASDSTSWYGFASAIFQLAKLDRRPEVLPIPSSDYPTQVRRPSNSRLSNEKLVQVFGLRAPRWDDALLLCLEGR
jgi:dTDP-4-dehydrorhamnose reductase